MCPALAHGFFPSEPPEKPLLYFLKLLPTSLEMLSDFHLTPVVLPARFHNGQVYCVFITSVKQSCSRGPASGTAAVPPAPRMALLGSSCPWVSTDPSCLWEGKVCKFPFG